MLAKLIRPIAIKSIKNFICIFFTKSNSLIYNNKCNFILPTLPDIVFVSFTRHCIGLVHIGVMSNFARTNEMKIPKWNVPKLSAGHKQCESEQKAHINHIVFKELQVFKHITMFAETRSRYS